MKIDGISIRPCVGCAYCCKTARCSISFEAEGKYYKDPFEALGEPKECPWLMYRGGRYRCKLARKYKKELAIGAGCCSPLNSTRREFIKQMKSS